MNILGIAEQGLWETERQIKRAIGMCETVGCWKRSTCTVGNDFGWSQCFCDKHASETIERILPIETNKKNPHP